MLKVIDDTSVKRKNGDNEKSNFAKRGREKGWDGKEKSNRQTPNLRQSVSNCFPLLLGQSLW